MSLQEQLNELDLLIPANDGISEPFQPVPTWERWKTQDLMANRDGTIIRSGLYVKDRKEIAEAISNATDTSNEKIADEATNRINADQDLNKRIIALENSHSTSAVTSVNAKTGDVVLSADDIKLGSGSNQTISDSIISLSTAIGGKADATSLGTASTYNVGNQSGQIPIVNVNGKLESSIIPEKPSVIKDVPRTTAPVYKQAVPASHIDGNVTFEVKNDKLWLDLTGVELTAAFTKNKIEVFWFDPTLNDALNVLYGSTGVFYIPVEVIQGSKIYQGSVGIETGSANVSMIFRANEDIPLATGTDKTQIYYFGVTQLTL